MPQAQYCQQCDGGPPLCYKCRGWRHINCNCSSTQNYTEQRQVKNDLNYQWGTTSEPVKFKRGPKYNNPDPVIQLIGLPDEAQVEANCVTTYALIGKGAKITTIAHSFIRQLQLGVYDLNEIICVEGTGGFTVLYLGYVQVNLWIPQFPQYEEMILMLVISDSQFIYGIPIQIGTWVIRKVMQMVNVHNFNKLSEVGRNKYGSTVMAGQLAFGETAKNVFDLSTIRGCITASKEVILSPLEMQTVPGVSKVAGYAK